MTVDEILCELRHAADPQRAASLKRIGATSPALGIGLPSLRSLAKRVGHDHRLALALWQTPCREPRILASMIDEPERVTQDQMDRWAPSFDSWEICDQVCRHPTRLRNCAWWPRERIVQPPPQLLAHLRLQSPDRFGADTTAYVFENPTHIDAYLETDAAVVVMEGKRTEAAPTTKTRWMPYLLVPALIAVLVGGVVNAWLILLRLTG